MAVSEGVCVCVCVISTRCVEEYFVDTSYTRVNREINGTKLSHQLCHRTRQRVNVRATSI